MPIPAGSRLGPYEITSPLGAGGMGEVYRARDTKLHRDVAIKILPEAVSGDPDRLMRFEREAQALAALNHPNIAQVYGLEHSGTTPAIVMELVEGPTLEEMSPGTSRAAPAGASGGGQRRALELPEALAIARQIAEALEAAHEAGIIHRDLKPANVKVKADGTVKVLDFGLAKALDPTAGGAGFRRPGIEPAGVGDSGSASPTMTSPAMTQMGMILGTAAYMSPEQAKGGVVDRRSDVWAFGVVLYEMLTGTRLFDAETTAETLAQVLTRLVDVGKLPPGTPARLRWLVARLLERNPKNRLHDMADARIVIEEVMAGGDADTTAPAPATGSQATWVVAAGAALVGFAAATLYFGFVAAPGADAPPALKASAEFEIAAPEGTGLVPGLALSPDGRTLAFVARGASGRTTLWVRVLDSVAATELAGTDDARYPFWAPDGRRIGFFAQGRLKTTDLLGGQPFSVADAGATQDVRGGAWGADDVILFAPTFTGPLYSVRATGGAVTQVTELADGGRSGTHRFPAFLPDGQRFLFYSSEGSGVEPGTIQLGRLGSRESKPLTRASSAAVFVAPDLVLYVQGDSLVAERWDDGREELVGPPVPLGVRLPGGISVSGQRSLGVSSSGVLVYRTDKRYGSRLVWVDRSGREVGEMSKGEETWYYSPRISPNGRQVAVAQYDRNSTNGNVWVHQIDRGIATRLTGEEGDASALTWSADGGTIVYASIRTPPSGIYVVEPDRPGQGRLWFEGDDLFPVSSAPDGRSFFYYQTDASGRPTSWVRPTGKDGEARRLDSGFATEVGPELRRDGRWVAYGSDATRRLEVYVRRMDDSSNAAVRVSPDGGFQPRWSPDGSELFYIDDAGRLVAVPFTSFDPLTPGTAVPLFTANLVESLDRQWDVAPDGRRFLLNRALVDAAPITIVLGWRQRVAELAAR